MCACVLVCSRACADVGMLCGVTNVTARESMEEAREHPVVETTGVAKESQSQEADKTLLQDISTYRGIILNVDVKRVRINFMHCRHTPGRV